MSYRPSKKEDREFANVYEAGYKKLTVRFMPYQTKESSGITPVEKWIT